MLITPRNLPEGRRIWRAIHEGVVIAELGVESGRLLTSKRTVPIRASRMQPMAYISMETPEVSLERYSGVTLKRNLSFQVGFPDPNRSVRVRSLVEGSIQTTAYVCIRRMFADGGFRPCAEIKLISRIFISM